MATKKVTKKATKKKATKKKATKKKAPTTPFQFVAVDHEGNFFACTEAPIFADGMAYWPCPDGHYSSNEDGHCCGENTKERRPTAKIKYVDPLNVHLNNLVDDEYGTNVPYIISYEEYTRILKNEKDGKGEARVKKPEDIYATAF